MKLTDKQIEAITENINAVDYELMARGTKKERQKLGQFFTPISLAVKMVAKFSYSGEPAKIIDPTCGYGNLLLAIMEAQIATGVDPVLVLLNTYGNELDANVLTICKENMRKFGDFHKIPKNIVEFCLATHFNNGNALEDSAYAFDMENMIEQARYFGIGLAYDVDTQKFLAYECK